LGVEASLIGRVGRREGERGVREWWGGEGVWWRCGGGEGGCRRGGGRGGGGGGGGRGGRGYKYIGAEWVARLSPILYQRESLARLD